MRTLLLFLVASLPIFGQGLISSNASFEKGLNSWQFGVASYDEDLPDAEFEVVEKGYEDESACKIRVKINSQSGNYNDVYLMRRGIELRKGKKYRVSFCIKSGKRSDKVMVSLGSGTPPDIQMLKDRELKFEGDNTWKKISFTFEASKNLPNVDFDDISLILGFNHRFGVFYVDNFNISNI